MRKKTIKFYFFNQICKNPSTNYLFAYSKRALKQGRQLKKIRKKLETLKTLKKRRELISYAVQYKNTIRYKFMINQWYKNILLLKGRFLTSYYFKKWTSQNLLNFTTSYERQLWFWFIFKNRFNRFTRRFFRKYLKAGFLSSHFVHIFSKKNAVYQVRSKYRSHTHNLNICSNYVYNNTKSLVTYNNLLKSLLYFFTMNTSKRSIWVDSDFNLITTSWEYSIIPKQVASKHNAYASMFMINNANFNSNYYKNLFELRHLFKEFFEATERSAQETIYKTIQEQAAPELLDYIYFMRPMLSVMVDNHVDNAPLHTVYRYLYLYKQL